ncbi:hypothetical protein HMPREF3155_02085 [Corynebacterium sp. HMSC06D04]|uniref:Uncharacterized protein n=2 Tax=Corynebacterium TaxID=1716 RepID=A0A2A4AMC3_9CORY|nr:MULTISPECIES: hypothetical protein [Corynebacterium]MDU3175765.1 hypothetical protein [Corynebacterium striatum]PCC83642.1 hypothetical protein COM45_02510 [Corynebacterium accolens]KXU17080.1 hypothetical protein WM41_2319 [Corynebacterium simulans]MCG7247992.1 hypothetical protein [Corynebacterium simulans]MCK6160950.1 hypothetical protein [Corynebacterium simulans]
MSTLMYIRTTMEVPGVGSAIHVAEMEEVDAETCTMLRMIALAPNDAVAGAATPNKSVGNADIPQSTVPHPNTYDNYPNISAEHVSEEDFTALWTEALALYGDL